MCAKHTLCSISYIIYITLHKKKVQALMFHKVFVSIVIHGPQDLGCLLRIWVRQSSKLFVGTFIFEKAVSICFTADPSPSLTTIKSVQIRILFDTDLH